jgi:hypothetical protein
MLPPQATGLAANQHKRLLQDAFLSAAAIKKLQATFHVVQKLQLQAYLEHAVATGAGIRGGAA